MPASLNTPVLTVDVGLIHKVDTRNVENLFSMWTVFSRCAGSLEEGRRLENLSWRLWNRETFCCVPEAAATKPALPTPIRSSTTELPDLSSSPGSVVDEEALDFDTDQTSASTSNPLEIARPQIRRQDSASSRSRGRERHITPDDLEKMVSTIKEKKDLEPLPSSLCPLPTPAEKQPLPPITPQTPTISATLPSTTQLTSSDSVTSERSTTSVVKGFSPAHVSSSYRSIPLASAPSSIPTADIVASDSLRPARRTGGFTLPGSSTDESSSERAQPLKKKSAMFTFGGSSNEEDASLPSRPSLRSALTESIQRPPQKQTSFREEVATRTIQEEQVFDDDVFETDEDDIDESAIDDDDDSSDWEDSNEESGHASIDDKSFFQRVDSRPNLTSRRSLITTMLHQNDRASALANAASKSTSALKRSPRASPNGPSLAASVESDDGGALMMKSGLKPISENPRAGDARTPAQPITTPARPTPHQLALSPRTTRRNMLATELTVSLRQNLLWERQQKSQTANAVLKRRHTAHDVADLKQYPEKVYMDKEDQDTNASWNQYFGPGLGEYHSKGW